jgi:hypothetical protein
MFDGVEHGLALREIASRREADQQARFQSPMNRGFGAGGDLTAGRQQRSVEIDGNQFVLHNVTIACQPKLASLAVDASNSVVINGFSTKQGMISGLIGY